MQRFKHYKIKYIIIITLLILLPLAAKIYAAEKTPSVTNKKETEKMQKQDNPNNDWELQRPDFIEYLPNKPKITYPENWIDSENSKDKTLPASSNSLHGIK